MFTQNSSLLPPAQPGAPLAAQIPNDDTNEGRNALVNTMGVDMRVDENGNYWLISYAHAAPAIANNAKARQDCGPKRPCDVRWAVSRTLHG